MECKFKVGDVVKRLIGSNSSTSPGYIGKIRSIKTCGRFSIMHFGDGAEGCMWSEQKGKDWLLWDETQEAISLLKEKGYSITPPPEPKSGSAYICENKFSGLLVFHTPPKNPTNKVIAVVPWTEGDGISEGGYYPGCDES